MAAVGLYSLLAVFAMVAAYLALFHQFAGYDDEGTLLVTLKSFAHGDVLYRDIYSEYGPFYYELFGGLFSLSGQAVTTDASRLIVMVLWVGTSLFYGIAAQRLSGRLALGLAGMAAAFSALYVLQAEPMHPQVLCVALLAAFTLLAALGPSRRVAWIGAGCGALLAALLMTKVNLGVFAIAAAVLAAVLTVEPLSRRRWLRWAVAVAFLAMPLAVMARDPSEGWVRDLLTIELLSMASLLLAAWRLRSAPGDDDSAVARWSLAAVAGFGVAFLAILVGILLTGPSLADVYDGVVTQALRVRDVLVTPMALPAAAVDWAVATVAAAAVVVRLRPSSERGPTIWPGLGRGLAGLVILFAIAHITPVGLNPSAANPITLPTLLAWVAAVPPAGPPESAYKRFLRILLPALAIGETLQVYPVAGSQMGIAAVTFVPVGVLCLGDALTSLRTWSEARDAATVRLVGVVAAVAAIALAADLTLDAMLRPAASNAIVYHEEEALPFKGATALRLPASEVETYSRLVDLLHNHRCTTFIGYPNIDSLYLWSEIEAPAPRAPGAWIKALDDRQQQRVVDEMRASPRPCAIRSDQRAEGWLKGSPPPDSPLVNYIFDDFRPVYEIGEFQFLLPKG